MSTFDPLLWSIHFQGLCLFDFKDHVHPRVILPFGLFGYTWPEPEPPSQFQVESHMAYIEVPGDDAVRFGPGLTDWPLAFQFERNWIFPIVQPLDLKLIQSGQTQYRCSSEYGFVIPKMTQLCKNFTLSGEGWIARMEIEYGFLSPDLVQGNGPRTSTVQFEQTDDTPIVITATPTTGPQQQIYLSPGTDFTIGNKYTNRYAGLLPNKECDHWVLYYKLAKDPPTLDCVLPGQTTVSCSNSTYP